MHLEQDDLAKILVREKLSLEDVKIVMRGARYEQWDDESIDYANSLLSDAGHYLPSHTLAALIRADISEKDAAPYLKRNKAFFSRLMNLLPSLVRFFSEEARSRNLKGIISCIDDCHNDFHFAASSSRKDRQFREAKEKIAKASKLANETAAALGKAKGHFDIEYDRYRAIYYPAKSSEPSRYLSDLIHELQMCSGVLEIVEATADINSKRLFLSSNDTRTTIVEWAYHMCTMWDGPKLVTTPGSDFAALCSLLFEAVSGRSDEGLAGAINRYARSDDRRQWDREGEEEEEIENDNFVTEKRAMIAGMQEIELCKTLLQDASRSDMAQALLYMRINHEQRKYDAAQNTYGPRQVLISHLNAEQWETMLMKAVNHLTLEQIKKLAEQISSGKSLTALDIALGKTRRSAPRNPRIDT